MLLEAFQSFEALQKLEYQPFASCEEAMRAVAKRLSADAERRAMHYLLLNKVTVKRGVSWS